MMKRYGSAPPSRKRGANLALHATALGRVSVDPPDAPEQGGSELLLEDDLRRSAEADLAGKREGVVHRDQPPPDGGVGGREPPRDLDPLQTVDPDVDQGKVRVHGR